MYPEFSKALRVVQWSVLVNLAIVVAGAAVGVEVLLRLAGIAPADSPLWQVPEVGAAVKGGLAVMLLGMLGVVPSLGLSIAGSAYLCGRLVPERIRRLAIISLVLFCAATGLVLLIGLVPPDAVSTWRRGLRCLALLLSLASHAFFLRALELSVRDGATCCPTLLVWLPLAALVLWAAMVLAAMFGLFGAAMIALFVLPTVFFVAWCLSYLWLLRTLST